MDVQVDVKLEEYWLMLMMPIEDDGTYQLEHDGKGQDRTVMVYVQDVMHKNVDRKNIEYSHIKSIDRYH